MNNKKMYVEPQVEIVLFSNEDILTVSGGIELPGVEWN